MPHCIVVHATHTEREDGELMWLAGRVGVDLSEACVGTTAPGMVAMSGRGCAVHGAEHYFNVNHGLQCAAAPIRDARGELVAVLDLSCESRDFQFDAAALVHLFATAIENRLLTPPIEAARAAALSRPARNCCTRRWRAWRRSTRAGRLRVDERRWHAACCSAPASQ